MFSNVNSLNRYEMTLQVLFITFVLLLFNVHIIKTENGSILKKLNQNFDNIVQVKRIECLAHDGAMVNFTECYVKPINRTTKIMSIHMQLLQLPLIKMNAHVTTFKRANGYKPFVISATLDMCKYFAGKRNRIIDWIYDAVLPYSNINHTCPYQHDFIVNKLPIYNITLPSLFPDGDYRMNLALDMNGKPTATVMMYLSIIERRLLN